jgi:AHBA synthesis associated protein
MSLRGVVFDLDGVLIDSIHVMREAFQRAYAETGGVGAAPFDDYLPHLGRHMPDTLRLMQLPAQMYPVFVRHSRELVHRVSPCPGAAELLDGLRAAGLALAVATGKARDRADHVLAAVGLLPRVDAVTGSDEVAHGKPAPDIVLLALDRLSLAPAEAVMVGDSPLDLAAGRAAGVRVAATLWGQGSRDQLLASRPDLVAASCAELGTLLHRLAHTEAHAETRDARSGARPADRSGAVSWPTSSC